MTTPLNLDELRRTHVKKWILIPGMSRDNWACEVCEELYPCSTRQLLDLLAEQQRTELERLEFLCMLANGVEDSDMASMWAGLGYENMAAAKAIGRLQAKLQNSLKSGKEKC